MLRNTPIGTKNSENDDKEGDNDDEATGRSEKRGRYCTVHRWARNWFISNDFFNTLRYMYFLCNNAYI